MPPRCGWNQGSQSIQLPGGEEDMAGRSLPPHTDSGEVRSTSTTGQDKVVGQTKQESFSPACREACLPTSILQEATTLPSSGPTVLQ